MEHLYEVRSPSIESNDLSVHCMQILDVSPEDEAEEDGANVDLDSQRKGKCVVLKTSTRQVSRAGVVYLFHSSNT